MRTRRQPDERFLRRMEEHRKPVRKVPEKPPSWIQTFKDSDYWLWGEFIGFTAVVIAMIAFVFDIEDRKQQQLMYEIDLKDREQQREAIRIDLEDRKAQRAAQAWELVTRPAPGNSGKGPALEFLNSQGIDLVGIDLSIETNGGWAYLAGIDLSSANLFAADLSGANLFQGDLSDANFRSAILVDTYFVDADLSGADFVDADLSSADLTSADLSDANFYQANLSGADLTAADLSGANLSGTDLSDSTNFHQRQLITTCGDGETKLPEGLKIEHCIR